MREENISPPRKGDIGYDVKSHSAIIKGFIKSFDSDSYEEREINLERYISDPNYFAIKRIDYIQYDTGLQIESDYGFFLYSRSSISKYNLLLANSVGVVDPQYRGNIIFRFKYIVQPEDLLIIGPNEMITRINPKKIYKIGDKIGQIKFSTKENYSLPEIELVTKLDETERNNGGFGSTDEKPCN